MLPKTLTVLPVLKKFLVEIELPKVQQSMMLISPPIFCVPNTLHPLPKMP
jgi:hypothetical protein